MSESLARARRPCGGHITAERPYVLDHRHNRPSGAARDEPFLEMKIATIVTQCGDSDARRGTRAVDMTGPAMAAR